MTSTATENNEESLQKIFQEGLDLYNNLGRIDEPTNSPAVQVKTFNFEMLMHIVQQFLTNKFKKDSKFIISIDAL